MNRDQPQPRAWYLMLPGIVLLVLSVLAACGTANEPSSQSRANDVATIAVPTAFSSVTTTPTEDPDRMPNPTEALATAQAFNTRVTQHGIDLLTSVALSPNPIYTPVALRTESPVAPTPTWESGWVDCPSPEYRNEPEYVSCWRSTLNGQLLWLFAGHQHGERADPQQGVLQVGFYDLSQIHLLSQDIYNTPQRVGAVRITSVSGTLVTLVPQDQQATPVVLVFDIATHQWGLSSPSPVPSVAPTP